MAAFHEQRRYSDSYHLTIHRAHEMDFLAHYHGEVELFFVQSGMQKLGINNQVLTLAAGQIGVVAPWHIHYYEDAGPVKGYMLIFDPDIMGRHFPTRSGLWTFNPGGDTFSMLSGLLLQLHDEMKVKHAYYELAASSLLNHFFVRLFRADKVNPFNEMLTEGPKQHELMQDVLTYLAGNFQNPINRDGLARQFGISSSHLSRIFKAATGLSLTEYLARLRVEQARACILAGRDSITDIALSSGFESIRTFNRCFHRIQGCSPSTLRQYPLGDH
ncbi:MAG: AraC family transcriptional regulator [Bacillota bacterium]|nr:AraC family transcriptional regulator [Bacillota bacterium]